MTLPARRPYIPLHGFSTQELESPTLLQVLGARHAVALDFYRVAAYNFAAGALLAAPQLVSPLFPEGIGEHTA